LSQSRPNRGLAGPAVIAILGLACSIGAPARAADNDVLQIKQAFEPATLEIAAGSSVTFVNADDVSHNLQAIAPNGVKTDQASKSPASQRSSPSPTRASIRSSAKSTRG
jgi:plastocyanin